MTLTSKPLAILILSILFGGIFISSLLGRWNTTTTKEPATFTEGEFAGQANPADIRGSYTFRDIETNFGVSPRLLAQAFGVNATEPASYQVKNLEAQYAESGYEIGTASIRLFVALYKGLPFDLSTDIYLPETAANLLLERPLTPEQKAYVQAHTLQAGAAGTFSPAETPEPQAESTSTPVPAAETERLVKGKTTFQELLDWGVSQQKIEEIIGSPIPSPLTKVKDHCTALGLDFETIKTQLQAEIK